MGSWSVVVDRASDPRPLGEGRVREPLRKIALTSILSQRERKQGGSTFGLVGIYDPNVLTSQSVTVFATRSSAPT